MTGWHVTLSGLGILAIVLVGLHSIVSDVWKMALLSVLPSRKRVGFVSAAVFTGVIVMSAGPLLGQQASQALPFLVVGLVPWLSWQVVTWWAWFLDGAAVRASALEIAVERTERDGDPAPRLDQRAPWKEYVFDVEAARRRSSYEPPPI